MENKLIDFLGNTLSSLGAEHLGIRRISGDFIYYEKQYTYAAYTIKHPAGPPTIRIDIKEKI